MGQKSNTELNQASITKEKAIIDEFILRRSQLHNIRKVMNGSITPKKLNHMSQKVLPGYLVRYKNAQSVYDKLASSPNYHYHE
jgi:hypothetical protein